VATDGQIHNRFRIVASNRSHTDKELTLSVNGLPQAAIMNSDEPLILAPGQSVQREFDVAAPPAALQPGVNRLRIFASVSAQKTLIFDEAFFAPMNPAISQPASGSTKYGNTDRRSSSQTQF
jgi:hypothetical protein